MKQHDPVNQLLNYLAGSLTPQEARDVERMICESPEVADQLIELAYDEYLLVECGDSVPCSDPQRVDTLPRRTARASWRQSGHWLIGSALGIIVLLMLFPPSAWKRNRLPAIIANRAAQVTLSTGEAVPSNIQQSLASGFLELLFPTGTKVFITAPAVYEVTGENSIRLQKGDFVANVPESGYGFQVDTPSGRLVDLGTVFSVHASEKDDTQLQVIRGKVIASLTNDHGGVRKSRQITENQAVKIDREHDEISETPYFNVISSKYGIIDHTRAVTFQERMPDLLASGKYQVFEHDNLAFVFPERTGVTLQDALMGDLDSPRSEQSPDELKARRRTIPAGTKVDCFRIYYDPVNRQGEGAYIPVEGEIRFARPIMGILLSAELLARTDKLFHPSSDQDPNYQIRHQGTEIDNTQVDQTGLFDVVSISPDRKTLSFLLKSGSMFVDEFRVLIESADNHPPAHDRLPSL